MTQLGSQLLYCSKCINSIATIIFILLDASTLISAPPFVKSHTLSNTCIQSIDCRDVRYGGDLQTFFWVWKQNWSIWEKYFIKTYLVLLGSKSRSLTTAWFRYDNSSVGQRATFIFCKYLQNVKKSWLYPVLNISWTANKIHKMSTKKLILCSSKY